MNSELTESPAAAIPASQSQLSRKRVWLFRLVALFFPVFLLIFIEIALRIAGYGNDLRLIHKLPQGEQSYTHVFNPSVELAYLSTDVSGPEPRIFTLPKPDKTFRIIVFGGSTVIGFPYASELAFPRQLEVMLQRQNPALEIEVLNAGITSMNSFAVADLVEQSFACEPDLLIIHTGHNEFYGPGGPASAITQTAINSQAALSFLKRTRLGQFISNLRPTVPADANLLDVLPTQFAIPLESAMVEQAEQNLRSNLTRIVNLAAEKEVSVLLTTVSSNVRDQSPMRPLWPASVDDSLRPEWEGLIAQAESQLLQTEYETAMETLKKAKELCSEHATLHYRLAQCHEALGNDEQAYQYYLSAKDLDGCRFRAPERFRAVTKEVAENYSYSGLSFLDLAEQVKQDSHAAGPGYDLYLEHVHYHFAGHFAISKALTDHVQGEIMTAEVHAEADLNVDKMKEELAHLTEDDLFAYSMTIEVLKTAPFRECLDLERQFERTANVIGGLYLELPEERRELFADLSMDLMGQNLVHNLKKAYEQAGHAKIAQKLEEIEALRSQRIIDKESRTKQPILFSDTASSPKDD